jgi:hypothetical protein
MAVKLPSSLSALSPNAAKADGWTVGTYLFDVGTDPPGITMYDYNALVRANAATLGITIIADNVAVTPDGENATGHFNVNGYTQMANQIETGFVALLA